MLPKSATRGEVYAARLPDGRFAACQVVAECEKYVEVVALRWIGDALPALDELAGIVPLEVYHHTHKPHVDRVNVDKAPPYWVTRVGVMEPVLSGQTPGSAFSSWRAPFHDVLRQWRWDNEVPATEKAAYVKAYRGGEVTLDLAGREHALDATTWRLWLVPSSERGAKAPSFAVPIERDARIDWGELLKLGALSEIVYGGSDPGFAEYLRSRKRIRRVVWRDHGQDEIDIRGSGVRIFGVDAGAGKLKLTIGALADLYLYGDASRLQVDDQRAGSGLRLHLQERELPEAPVGGITQLGALSARNLSVAHLSRLGVYEQLRGASLAGAPGELRELGALRDLKSLRRLALRDFYGDDFDAFPEPEAIEHLDTLEVHGLPEGAIEGLCKRGRMLRRCSITGAKSEAWISANAR